jgi:hypothetical protein
VDIAAGRAGRTVSRRVDRNFNHRRGRFRAA